MTETNAERVARRTADKARAAKVVEQNATDAQKAKRKAQAKAQSLGNEDFLARAKRIEAQINAPKGVVEATEEQAQASTPAPVKTASTPAKAPAKATPARPKAKPKVAPRRTASTPAKK